MEARLAKVAKSHHVETPNTKPVNTTQIDRIQRGGERGESGVQTHAHTFVQNNNRDGEWGKRDSGRIGSGGAVR